MKTHEFFRHYDEHHKNRINQILHFISAAILVVCCVIVIIFKTWWLIPLAIIQAYLIPHWGHKHFEKNKSMRNVHPVGCVLGNTRMFMKTFTKLITKGKI